MRILLGISGGIAAYKTPELVRLLQQRGHTVQVALTRAAREFVAPLTLATLSREPVLDELFPAPAPTTIEHIDAAQAANVVVVAPATAHTLARMALGVMICMADSSEGALTIKRTPSRNWTARAAVAFGINGVRM